MLITIAVGLACFFGEASRSIAANSERLVINLPVYDAADRDVVSQAESLAETTISRQFRQNPTQSIVQVVVTADRHGEVIPIVAVTVSRAQWQANPQVSAWSKYFRSIDALLHRDDSTQVVAMGGAMQRRSFEIDRAFDEGRLTGPAAQQYLSDLD